MKPYRFLLIKKPDCSIDILVQHCSGTIVNHPSDALSHRQIRHVEELASTRVGEKCDRQLMSILRADFDHLVSSNRFPDFSANTQVWERDSQGVSTVLLG